MMELLNKLTAAFGPSGREDGVRAVIREALPANAEVTEDVLGNLIVHIPGPGKKLLFAAHCDSLGLIVTHVDEDGTLRVGALGGIRPAALHGTPVVFENGTQGVVYANEDKKEKLTAADLYIDIGASNADEAKKSVQIGDTAVWQTPFLTRGSHVFSRFLDDRCGCVALLKAMEQIHAPKNDLYFAFTVQEEVGTRGAGPVAFAVQADYGVAVDVTPADDVPGSAHIGNTKLGAGAAVHIMDRSVLANPVLIAAMNEVAAQKGIEVQHDVLRSGGTDAGKFASTAGGMRAGGISVPCRNTHSPIEQIDLRDLQACVDLIAALAETELPA